MGFDEAPLTPLLGPVVPKDIEFCARRALSDPNASSVFIFSIVQKECQTDTSIPVGIQLKKYFNLDQPEQQVLSIPLAVAHLQNHLL